MTSPDRKLKVVIVGRDESLWLAANVLWRAFNRAGLDITLVELPSLLRAVDAYPTLKQQEAYHALLGIEEAPTLRAAKATYSLGQRFSNFGRNRPPFYHAYSTYGRVIERVPFHQYWLKARTNGLKAEYDDFSINAVAAKNGRFFVPGGEVDGFAICDYGYHLDARGYCHVLKAVARQRGLVSIEARLGEIVLDPLDGRITALKLMNGQTVEGDFFIDCSGSESALLGSALGVGQTSWRKWFPCDTLMTTSAPPLSPLPSFAQISAHRSGWVAMYPLRDRTCVQQMFSSLDMTPEQALEAAAMVTNLRVSGDAVIAPLFAGARTSFWHKNCVGIGEAAVSFDPIDSVRMHANLLGLSHLISLFPVDRNTMLESLEYNRNIGAAYERVRDYQMCHYLLNQRIGQPLWDHSRAVEPPETLRYKLDMFAARGHLVQYDDETFEEHDWVSMFLGHGLLPRAYDPLVDQMSDAEMIQQFQKMLGFIRMNVEKMGPMEPHLGAMPVQA